MNGDSKFLTLAALGVIGLGSAMPYWSAWSAPNQAPPEISTAQPAAPQPADEPRLTAQQYWDQQVSRPDVVTLTPRGGQSMGLDNPAQIPSLSMDMQQATPVAAQPILANVPINQVGSVSLASRVEDMGAPKTASRAVVPIEIPGSARPLPPTMTSPVITTRQVMKPELPETQVQQQFTPLPRIAPPNHGASNSGSKITREHRVRDGDSLESIAEKYLGDPLLADAVFRANRSQLDTPELLPIGITLMIPSSSVEQSAPEVDGQLRPMTRLRPVSTGAGSRGGELPWTTLSPPGT
ncbi:LysM peptidoglycan-binding domain-containing protein [Bremerella alba]|nr:LysM domain-containing protein [Bremerella alba]